MSLVGARGAGHPDTFAQAAVDFIEQHAKRKTRDWRNQARLLGLTPDDLKPIPDGLADRWAGTWIAEIDGDAIYALIDEVREKGTPGLERRAEGPSEARARALFRVLSRLFSWLVVKRRLSTSPCAGVARPDAPRSRDRVLNGAEVVKFWQAASAERAVPAAVLKLLLLTGCRLNEVTGMRRAELSADAGTWTIPGTRTKNHRVHVVPLPPTARELIAAGDGDLVFTTDGQDRLSKSVQRSSIGSTR